MIDRGLSDCHYGYESFCAEYETRILFPLNQNLRILECLKLSLDPLRNDLYTSLRAFRQGSTQQFQNYQQNNCI